MAETLDIVVTKTGDKEAAQGISAIGSAAEKTGKQVDTANQLMEGLKKTLAALGIVATVEAAKSLSDTYQGMISRLKLVTTSAADLVATEQKLFDISQRTRGSFEETTNLYNKLALSAGQLGVDSKDLLPVIENINKAIAISGTSAEEAKAGLLQFGQGLAANRLQGDELRSVLENLPFLGQQIAKGLGTTTVGLRQLGETGQLTAKQVLDAITKQSGDIEKQFQTITPTISSAFQTLTNQVLRFVGTQGQVSGASAAIANAILLIANNFKFLVAGVETAVVAFASYRAALLLQPVAAAFVSGVFAMNAALQAYVVSAAAAGVETTIFGRAAAAAAVPVSALRGLVASLWAIIAANPFTLIITAIGAAAAAVYFFGNSIKLTSDGSITLLGAVVGAWNLLGQAITYVKNLLAPFVGPIWEAIKSAAGSVLNFVISLFNGLINLVSKLGGIFSALPGSVGALGQTIIKAMQDATKATNDTTLASANLGTSFGAALGGVAGAAGAATKALSELEKEMGVQTGRVNADLIPAFHFAVDGAKLVAETLAHVREQMKQNEQETAALANQTRNAFGQMITITDEWARRSGAAFNQVSGEAAAVADQVAESTDKIIKSYSDASSAASSANSSFSTTSTYLPDIKSSLDNANAQGGGLGDGSTFKSLQFQSDVTYGTLNGNNTLLALNEYMKSLPAATARSLVQSYPYLNQRFQGAGLPTFANGGEFMVGGTGGTDSQLVQFMASPDERVTIQTPAQQRGGGGRAVTVNFVVNANDANSFRRSQNQMLQQLSAKLSSIG